MTYIGRKLKIRTWDEITKEYPNIDWSYDFFTLNGGRKYKILNEENNQLKVNFFVNNNAMLENFVDIRIFKLKKFFHIPEEMYEI